MGKRRKKERMYHFVPRHMIGGDFGLLERRSETQESCTAIAFRVSSDFAHPIFGNEPDPTPGISNASKMAIVECTHGGLIDSSQRELSEWSVL
jgi:hypothetical protein